MKPVLQYEFIKVKLWNAVSEQANVRSINGFSSQLQVSAAGVSHCSHVDFCCCVPGIIYKVYHSLSLFNICIIINMNVVGFLLQVPRSHWDNGEQTGDYQ